MMMDSRQGGSVDEKRMNNNYVHSFLSRGDPDQIGMSNQGGGDRIRTGVQTYSSKAFYMLILFCYFGKQLETNNRLLP